MRRAKIWEWVQLWVLLPLVILALTAGAYACSQDIMGAAQ